MPKCDSVIYTTYDQTKQWLDSVGIEHYTIMPDTLEVNVSIHVKLANTGMTHIPVKFDQVAGDFDCQHNLLTSLIGAPNKVYGNFYCNCNELCSLKGAPEHVGGDFWCNTNYLADLQHAPAIVGQNFICNDNVLVSLEGAPKSIYANFKCNHNLLSSLEGAPKEVKGSFWCHNNNLTSLTGAPELVGHDFICYANSLGTLQNCPSYITNDIEFDGNEEIFDHINKDIKHVRCLTLVTPPYDIKGLMHIFLIKHIAELFFMQPTMKDVEALHIINKHLHGDRSGPSCQIELIDAGLGAYARI